MIACFTMPTINALVTKFETQFSIEYRQFRLSSELIIVHQFDFGINIYLFWESTIPVVTFRLLVYQIIQYHYRYMKSSIKWGILTGPTPTKHDQILTKIRPKPNQNLTRTQPKLCQNLNKTWPDWPEPDENLTKTWRKPDQNLTNTWPKPDQNLTSTWPEPDPNLTKSLPELDQKLK